MHRLFPVYSELEFKNTQTFKSSFKISSLSALDRKYLETKIDINNSEEEFKPTSIFKVGVVNKEFDHELSDQEEQEEGEPEWEMLEGEEKQFGLFIIKTRNQLSGFFKLVKAF